MPFVTFYIYGLRFQDTWKGFAPCLLIGYRPRGSLPIYVPNKSPRKAVSLLCRGLSPHLDMSQGVIYNPKMLGKWTLPAMGTWVALVCCYTYKPNYCQSNELLMTKFHENFSPRFERFEQETFIIFGNVALFSKYN